MANLSSPTAERSISLDLGDGQELSRLTSLARQGLAHALGAGEGDRSTAVILEHLQRPGAVAAMLEELGGEQIFAAALLAFVTRASATHLHEVLSLRLGADAAVRAVDGLAQIGLCHTSSYEPRQVSMPACVQVALRPHLAAVHTFGGTRVLFEHAEHEIDRRLFEDGVLLAHLAGVGPKLTQSGEMFKRDLTASQTLFQGRFVDPQILAEEIDILADLGLLEEGSHIDVPGQAVASFAGLDRAEKLRRHLLARARAVPTLGPLFQLLVLAQPIPLTNLVTLAELDTSGEPTLWHRGRPHALDGPARIDLLLLQPGIGIADEGSARLVGLAPSLRSALNGAEQAEPSHDAQLHILPSMEAVVPPEFPLTLLVELGRFFDLIGVETVARFKLTRESVERAAQRGLTALEMEDKLEAAARFGLPDNVRRALRDFSQTRPDRVHVIAGPVVVAADPAARELVTSDPELTDLLSEVAPGVFEMLGNWEAGQVRKRLAALGIWRARDEASDETRGRVTRWDADDELRRLARIGKPSKAPEAERWARQASAALELAALGPALPGAAERLKKATGALSKDPASLDRFLSELAASDPQGRERLKRIFDPALKPEDQLDKLDRAYPDWVSRSKVKKPKKKAAEK